MTTTHLGGYLLIALFAALFVFALFAETSTGLMPWVRRLRRVQHDWRSLRLDLSQVADASAHQPASSPLNQLCALPANRVFTKAELASLAANYHTLDVRETWKILGATAFPRERVFEVANHMRIYVIIFLLLVGLNTFALIPSSADLTAALSKSPQAALHGLAEFLGMNIGRIVAVKEAVIIGFFAARLYGERSVFLNFAKD